MKASTLMVSWSAFWWWLPLLDQNNETRYSTSWNLCPSVDEKFLSCGMPIANNPNHPNPSEGQFEASLTSMFCVVKCHPARIRSGYVFMGTTMSTSNFFPRKNTTRRNMQKTRCLVGSLCCVPWCSMGGLRKRGKPGHTMRPFITHP